MVCIEYQQMRRIFAPTYTKMRVAPRVLNIFSKIRILREAENTYYPFPGRKHSWRHGNRWEFRHRGGKYFFITFWFWRTRLRCLWQCFLAGNGQYVFSASRRIRIFEKILRIHEVTSILVEVGEKFRSIYCYSM